MASKADSHSVAKRLQSELKGLMMAGSPGISAFPDGDNIFNWVGTIQGAPGTVYESLEFKLSLKFPTDYPFKAPVVKFETACFHPNVDLVGNICLDILKEKWSPIYNVRTLLLSIQSLLAEPNNDSPLNSYAASMWENQEEYKKVLIKKYQEATNQSSDSILEDILSSADECSTGKSSASNSASSSVSTSPVNERSRLATSSSPVDSDQEGTTAENRALAHPGLLQKREASLLVLERKGLVKEISAKFQTPDTATFTRLNPNTQVSIKERISSLKKENERKKVEGEVARRERVIKLVEEDDLEPLSAPVAAAKARMYTGAKDDNSLATKDRDRDAWKRLQSGEISAPPSPKLGGSKINLMGRKRRGRNPIVPVSINEINSLNLSHFLSIPASQPPAHNTRPCAPLSKDTKDLLRRLVAAEDPSASVATGLEAQIIEPTGDAANLRLRALRAPFRVQILLPNLTTTTIICKPTETTEALKLRLMPSIISNDTAESFVDSYLIIDMHDTPLEKTLALGKSEYILSRRAKGLLPKLKMIEKAAFVDADTADELSSEDYLVIAKILPDRAWRSAEVAHFRTVAARLRYAMLPEMKGEVHAALAPRLSPLPPPPVTGSTKMLASVFLPILQVTKTVEIEATDSADTFLARIFVRSYAKHLPPAVLPSDFILKAMGSADYIWGSHNIRSFEAIRSALVQGNKPNLVLVQRPKTESVPAFSPRCLFPPESPIRHTSQPSASKLAPVRWDELTSISIREIRRPFRVRILGASNIPMRDDASTISLIVSCSLFHGIESLSSATTRLETLTPALFTSQPTTLSARWGDTLSFPGIDYASLPMETRLCVSLYANKPDDDCNFPVGWANVALSDHLDVLRTGTMTIGLWPDDVANPLAPCSSNGAVSAVSLVIEFDQFALPVVFPTIAVTATPITPTLEVSKELREFFESVVKLDPLSSMSRDRYIQLWAMRAYAPLFPQVLPRLLLSVPWTQPHAVDEMHLLLARWPVLVPFDALELLDAKHVDRRVREYAVTCLESLEEEALCDILLQLVQVLKYERTHDSALARFLLRKALGSRPIGHLFFWYLKADLHVANIAERFGLLLEAYLHACGSHRTELASQINVIDSLGDVARKIKPLKDVDRRDVMLRELEAIEWPKRFQITLNPRFESNGLVTAKCKYMDSKKLPLRLSFTNIDMGAETIEVIFKVGDDLRQDMLTLQMIRLMDKLWQKEGLDLKLSPYGCISTGDMIGMIEVVLNSETTAKIQKSAGGATAAFKLDPLANWLLQHNKSEQEYAKAVDTFILSCAGYCVATYVLGIGDRHNDNLMCTKLGRLFHIDFGHFLGNYKKKFGFKRERAPFVFTPDFCYVMGGKESAKFVQFVNYCCTAYNILRRNAKLFMNLFAMMVSTGIPELQSMDDLNYLRESFSLELNDDKAREKFIALIHESLTTKTTQLNNAIHILAH
eukprot:gene10564-12289_t